MDELYQQPVVQFFCRCPRSDTDQRNVTSIALFLPVAASWAPQEQVGDFRLQSAPIPFWVATCQNTDHETSDAERGTHAHFLVHICPK